MHPLYTSNIARISEERSIGDPIAQTFVSVLDFVTMAEFRGACHATSAILHVLLSAQGVKNSIVHGELARGKLCFDHSWVEIHRSIYDIAIALPLQEQFDSSPVFAGRDVLTLGDPIWKYGIRSGLADDQGMKLVRSKSFVEFMDDAPFHEDGLWHFAREIGLRLGLKLRLNTMRKIHAQEKWL